jgi:hypothetical protein
MAFGNPKSNFALSGTLNFFHPLTISTRIAAVQFVASHAPPNAPYDFRRNWH